MSQLTLTSQDFKDMESVGQYHKIACIKKLKREHAMMKRFFTARHWADRHEAFKIIRCKMPKLFKE